MTKITTLGLWLIVFIAMLIPVYPATWSDLAGADIAYTDDYIFDDFAYNTTSDYSIMSGSGNIGDIIYNASAGVGIMAGYESSPTANLYTLWQYTKNRNVGAGSGDIYMYFDSGFGTNIKTSYLSFGSGYNDSSVYTRGIVTYANWNPDKNFVLYCYNHTDGTLLSSQSGAGQVLNADREYVYHVRYTKSTAQAELYDLTLNNYPINISLSGCDNPDTMNISLGFRINNYAVQNFLFDNLMVTPDITADIPIGTNMTALMMTENDVVTRHVDWYINDALSVNGSDTYVVPYEAGSQNISARIYMIKAANQSITDTPAYQVEAPPNVPPVLSGGVFNQSNYNNLQDMTYTVTGTDFESDPIDIYFEWYVDGGLVRNESVIGGVPPQTLSDSLPHTYYTAGQNVSLMIYAYDGEDNSAAYEDSVIILPNTAPEISAGCDDITLYHNINLSCSYSVTDLDNIAWSYYINDSDINISSDGITADISDDAVLSDYGCRDITINVTDGALWDSDSFLYCINDTAPTISFNLAGFYYIDSNISVDVSVTDAESDPINVTYVWSVDGVVVKTAYLFNMSEYDVYLESENASDFDVITLNVSASDTVLYTELIKESVYRVPSDNLLSDNYCPDDIEGVMLLFVVFVILAFFLVIDLMINMPILGMISGVGFIALGLVVVGCHPMMGFITATCGILYVGYTAFARQY